MREILSFFLPDPSFNAIVEAAREADHRQFLAWKQAGRQLNVRRGGVTPLLLFAREGNVKAAEVYVSHCPQAVAEPFILCFYSAAKQKEFDFLCNLLLLYNAVQFLDNVALDTLKVPEIYQKTLTSLMIVDDCDDNVEASQHRDGKQLHLTVNKLLQWGESQIPGRLLSQNSFVLKAALESGHTVIACEILSHILTHRGQVPYHKEEEIKISAEIVWNVTQFTYPDLFPLLQKLPYKERLSQNEFQNILNECLVRAANSEVPSNDLGHYYDENISRVRALLNLGANPWYQNGIALEKALERACEDTGEFGVIDRTVSIVEKTIINLTFDSMVIPYLKKLQQEKKNQEKIITFAKAIARAIVGRDLHTAPQSLDFPLKLELSKCELTDPVVTELIGGLIELRRPLSYVKEQKMPKTYLHTLNLANNQLEKNTGEALASLFYGKMCVYAKRWASMECGISILDLSNNPSLGSDQWNLGGTFLRNSGIQKLVEALHRNISLRILKLANTGANDRDFPTIAEMLMANQGLTYVDLSKNEMITADSQSHLKLLLLTRHQNKLHALRPNLSGTGLQEAVLREYEDSFTSFENALTDGLKKIAFKSRGALIFQKKTEPEEVSKKEFAKKVLICLHYLPTILSLTTGLPSAVANGLVEGLSSGLMTLVDATHHMGPWMHLIKASPSAIECFEDCYEFWELVGHLRHSAEHRQFIKSSCDQLKKTAYEFTIHNLGEKVAHQLSCHFEKIVRTLAPGQATHLGLTLVNCLDTFMRQPLNFDWDVFANKFQSWILRKNPPCYEVVRLENGCDVWVIDFLRGSGLRCLDRDKNEVSFDLTFKLSLPEEQWVSTQGKTYGHRNASPKLIKKINSMVKKYNLISDKKPMTSCCGKLKLSIETLQTLSGLGELVAIQINYQSLKEQLVQIEKNQVDEKERVDQLKAELASQKDDLKDVGAKINSMKDERSKDQENTVKDKAMIASLEARLEKSEEKVTILREIIIALTRLYEQQIPDHPDQLRLRQLTQRLEALEREATLLERIQIELVQAAVPAQTPAARIVGDALPPQAGDLGGLRLFDQNNHQHRPRGGSDPEGDQARSEELTMTK
jgi:hypothetical protein